MAAGAGGCPSSRGRERLVSEGACTPGGITEIGVGCGASRLLGVFGLDGTLITNSALADPLVNFVRLQIPDFVSSKFELLKPATILQL